MSVKTQDDKPYIEKKPVVLCRSGIMEYTRNEAANMAHLNPTRAYKDIYKVYRPKSVVLGAIEMMKDLPITVEHPNQFISPENWSKLVRGHTTSDIDVVPLENGEIGIKSHAVFPTYDLYNYLLNGNEDVSLGYEATYVAVDDPDAVGYDIVMTEITSVNHLALTAAGRGGKEVSVLDSLIGGMKMSVNSGLFYRFKKALMTKDAKGKKFSELVMDSVQKAKGLEGDAFATEVSKITDSIGILKDCPAKEVLLGIVKDSFAEPDLAFANKAEVMKTIDAKYEEAEKSTMDDDGRGTGTANIQDKKDGDNDDDDKGGKDDGDDKGAAKPATGTADAFTIDTVKALIKESQAEIMKGVESAVKAALGIKEEGASAKGGEATTDSATKKAQSAVLDNVDLGEYLL